ncbi:MAG: hypothetical protein HUU01_11615 [Saprospiraceae bacterium]|nr:hypothetical protein [Saprospiraceae bacterium]
MLMILSGHKVLCYAGGLQQKLKPPAAVTFMWFFHSIYQLLLAAKVEHLPKQLHH